MSYNQNGKNKLKEWQNHQYDLGYYLGGQQHYSLDNPGKPAIIGKFIILTGLLQLLVMAAITLSVINGNNAMKVILFYVAIALLSLLYIKVGLRLIRKEYNEKDMKNLRKNRFIRFFIDYHYNFK